MGTRDLFALRDLPRALHGLIGFSVGAASAEDRVVRALSIDSRRCPEDSLFVALPGEHTDGHRFVMEAFRAGAVAALIREGSTVEVDDTTYPVIRVPDTLKALQELAAWYVRSVLGSTVRIGITGSNGKTTTKEIVASILRCAAPTSASSGNLNSETGVPLAVFDTDPAARFAVFEMAMSNPGEMEPLARIVQPQYALITNIGTAHIGLLGSREAIAREKKAIASCFDGSQCLLVPEADDFTEFLTHSVRGSVKYFGPVTQNVELDTTTDPEQVMITGGESCTVPLAGYHNGLNTLAAIALAREIGVPDSCIQVGLSSLALPPGRSEVIRGREDRVILNDSYNANPDSMKAALDAVASLHRSRQASEKQAGRLVLILGAMKELGDATETAHETLLHQARALSPEVICLVGTTEWTRNAESGVRLFEDVHSLLDALPDILRPGQTILLKGSRSVELERILPHLRENGDA